MAANALAIGIRECGVDSEDESADIEPTELVWGRKGVACGVASGVEPASGVCALECNCPMRNDAECEPEKCGRRPGARCRAAVNILWCCCALRLWLALPSRSSGP